MCHRLENRKYCLWRATYVIHRWTDQTVDRAGRTVQSSHHQTAVVLSPWSWAIQPCCRRLRTRTHARSRTEDSSGLCRRLEVCCWCSQPCRSLSLVGVPALFTHTHTSSRISYKMHKTTGPVCLTLLSRRHSRRGGDIATRCSIRPSVRKYVCVYLTLTFTVYTITRKILEWSAPIFCGHTLGSLGQHEFSFWFCVSIVYYVFLLFCYHLWWIKLYIGGRDQ